MGTEELPKALYTAYLEGSLELSSTGQWIHEGRQFLNLKIADLFSRSIVWDPELKRYFVQIGNQRASFTCSDTAYFIIHIDESVLPWSVSVSDGSKETFNPEQIFLGAENQIYFLVKGSHFARLSHSAHQTLLAHAVDEESIEVNGRTFKLKKR